MSIDDSLVSRNFPANLREDNLSFAGVLALAKGYEYLSNHQSTEKC
jgi:hypothetical protein